jgi:Zn-dependent protease with chaperone function
MGFGLRSTFMITLLFGMLFAIVMMIGYWFNWGLPLMLIVTLLILGLQYLISPYIVGWIYRIDWIPLDVFKQQYPHLGELVNVHVRKHGIKPPRLGIIHDGNPNAFTFGHHKNNARLVITDGILQHLNKKEQAAVFAHEFGHIVHSDFIIMVLVSAIPVLFYVIARWAFWTGRYTVGRSRDDEGSYVGLALFAVGVLAYIAYILGYFISLVVSRYREYYADEHSGEVLENPNYLSTALVKIAYGLLEAQDRKSEANKSTIHSLRGLGIYNKKDAKKLALSSVGSTGSFSKENVVAAAAWDLHNPWAKYYQILSTHPLPAKRILALNKQCAQFNVKPEIDLTETKQRAEEQAGKSLWDEFLTDIFWLWLPSIIFWGFVAFTIAWVVYFVLTGYTALFGLNLLLVWGIAFVLMGFGAIARTVFKYRTGFQPYTVADLVTNVKVSPIRPVPAIIRGKIIGRGIPGLFYSEDLFFQDDTGLLYVDYNFGLRIVDFFWGLIKADKIVGMEVEITGWYRRAPSPYIQISSFITQDGKRRKNYQKMLTYLSSIIYFLVSVLLFWLAFFVI